MDSYSEQLVSAVESALPGWVVRCVESTCAQQGIDSSPLRGSTEIAAHEAQRHVVSELRVLLERDWDDQPMTPLEIVRQAVAYPSEVLSDAGVSPVARDEYRIQRFPADDYDLTPSNWSDVDGSLVDAGTTWGAAKVMAHRARHQPPSDSK